MKFRLNLFFDGEFDRKEYLIIFGLLKGVNYFVISLIFILIFLFCRF